MCSTGRSRSNGGMSPHADLHVRLDEERAAHVRSSHGDARPRQHGPVDGRAPCAARRCSIDSASAPPDDSA